METRCMVFGFWDYVSAEEFNKILEDTVVINPLNLEEYTAFFSIMSIDLEIFDAKTFIDLLYSEEVLIDSIVDIFVVVPLGTPEIYYLKVEKDKK